MSELTTRATSPVILYTTGDGKVTVDVWFANNNFWLTQKAMAELLVVKTPAVNKGSLMNNLDLCHPLL